MTETLTADVVDTGGLVRRAPRDVVLMPVMDVKFARQRLEELQEFCANYLQESADGGTDGGDYGIIPGAGKKKGLFKSGADKLCDVYGLADRYIVLVKVEDFDRGLFDYTIECDLSRKTDEMFVGSGLGSCSTWEAKYRWRDSQRQCPHCGATAIIKGKGEFGGGWLCWGKKGGCGAKFTDDDPAIAAQKSGRVENPDIIDTKNTVLKMAKKRAKIDAVIGVTRSSGIFTQDLEEHERPDEKVVSTPPAPPRAPAPVAAPPVTSPVTQPSPTAADLVEAAVIITKVDLPWVGQKGNAKAFLFHSGQPAGSTQGFAIYSSEIRALAEACHDAGTPVLVEIVESKATGKPYVKSIRPLADVARAAAAPSETGDPPPPDADPNAPPF